MSRIDNRTTTYQFNPFRWARAEEKNEELTLPKEKLQVLDKLRDLYPELSDWDNQTLGKAWSNFSEDFYASEFWNPRKREGVFLGYLYLVENGEKESWSGFDPEATETADLLAEKYPGDEI